MHKFTFDGEEYEWQNGIYMKKVRVMGKGMSFGELALTVGGPRTATIKCGETDCEFATLNKDSFLKSMESINLKRLNHEIDFLFSISIFS
jgi:CRP-like cAMP-binding protein